MWIKLRDFFLFVAVFCLLVTVASRVGSAETPIVTGSGFYTVIENGDAIAFQTDFTMTLEVTTGTLNASSCSVVLSLNRGHFSFYSNDSATLLCYPNREEVIGFNVEGSTFTEESPNTFLVVVPVDTQITISWFYRLPSFIDLYFYTAMGLGGVFLMVFSPTWCVWKIKKSGADVTTVERFGYAMLLFLVGFGLVVVWLWG